MRAGLPCCRGPGSGLSLMVVFVRADSHGLKFLDGVIETLNPGEAFGFCLGHAAIEFGVVTAVLPGGVQRVEEEVVLSRGETS